MIISRELRGETSNLVDRLKSETAEVREKQTMMSLADFLKNCTKSRGPKGGREDLGSHFEEFIIKEGSEISVVNLEDLQKKLLQAGVDLEIMGVQSWGNAFQKVEATVHGVDPSNPESGYERPTVAEGPHMVLVPYAFDEKGEMHIFRTLQQRTGEVVLDTPRGFAPKKEREDGTVQYDIDSPDAESRVEGNLKKVLKDETGKGLLKIKKITYLGAPRVNTSFVTSQSAMFAVEVDYDNFLKHQNITSPEEIQRQEEQYEHEGMLGKILDMNVDEYLSYRSSSEINRDLTADSPSDMIVMDFLYERLKAADILSNKRRQDLKTFGDFIREFIEIYGQEDYKKLIEKVKKNK